MGNRQSAILKRVGLVMGFSVLLLGGWIALPVRLERPATLSLALEDRHGLSLRVSRAADGSRAGWMPIADMDPRLIQAFVALEDRRFYHHHGVDPRAAARAAWQAVSSRRIVSGASTITMQLARLLRPGSRGLTGKASQVLWALRLDAHLDKQEILEHYLNRVPLGQGTVGVQAAAALYYGASADQLSLGQAALLAGIASRPSGANPIASRETAEQRRAVALERMAVLGYVSELEAGDAARETIARDEASPFLAPHFTTRILSFAADSGLRGDQRLRTSIDLALQSELEAEVRHTVTLLAESEVREGSIVVLDNLSGEILAWVGSPDFWSDTAGQVDMVISPRQPGSALKPFLYALAFDRGFTAATLLPDEPRVYRTATGPYTPRNYDRRYHGPTPAREALASSFNVPAVELTNRLGAGSLLHVLHEAGMRSLRSAADQYGLGLALGNGDVSLLELANGYRGLVNGGVWTPVTWRARPPGERPAGDRPFVSPGAALLTLDILSDPVARIPGFGTETPFDFPFPVAVKTGTSHHFTDNWAVGVTGGFTVAVWVGNFSGRPMRRVSGVTGAGPLLQRAVLAVARRYQPGALPTPQSAGAVRLRICRTSGELAGPGCRHAEEWFLPGSRPTTRCGVHEPARAGDAVAGAAAAAAAFEIVSPRDGDRYEIPPGLEARYATIDLRVTAAEADLPVRWLVDGRQVAPGRWPLASGSHRITAVSATGRFHEVGIEVR